MFSHDAGKGIERMADLLRNNGTEETKNTVADRLAMALTNIGVGIV